ncbi:MAG: AtpZ/AtpI family protein [Candidatus Binatia bacterium]
MTDELPRRRATPWALAGKLTAVAFEFVSFIAGGVVLGSLLDRWLGAEPWLLIAFTLFGTCGGFYQMLRTLRVLQKDV